MMKSYLILVVAFFVLLAPTTHALDNCIGRNSSTVITSYCTGYNNTDACCTSQMDAGIAASDSKLKLVFGGYMGSGSNCYQNVKKIFCGANCDKTQLQFTNVDPPQTLGGITNLTVYMGSTYSGQTWMSCTSNCMGPFGLTADDVYTLMLQQKGVPSPSTSQKTGAFIDSLSTKYDPTYVPAADKPRVSYTIGAAPVGGGSLSPTAVGTSSGPYNCPSADAFCVLPMYNSPETPNPAQTLSGTSNFCSDYNGKSACCTNGGDAQISSKWTTAAKPLFGDSCCGMNLKKILCGIGCSPKQAAFMAWTKEMNTDQSRNLTIYINQTMAQTVYESCKEVCFTGGVKVKNVFPTLTAFVSSFSTNVPSSSYTPDLKNPRITWMVGTAPSTIVSGVATGGGALTVDVSGPCGDTSACGVGPISGVATILPSLVFLVAVTLTMMLFF